MARLHRFFTIFSLTLMAGFSLFGVASAQSIDLGSPDFHASDLAVNQNTDWGPVVLGPVLRMTDKQPSQISSVYTKKPMNITKFTTSFVACFTCASQDDSDCADGITFIIQNNDTKALGSGGGQLGYGGIGKSVAVKFDTAQNTEFTPPDPSNDCIGLYKNGEVPCGGTDISLRGIDFRTHDPMSVKIDYDGKILHFFMTDIRTQAHVEQNYFVNIPETVGSKTAYVGFTGACGLGCSEQDVVLWKFSSAPLPAAADAPKQTATAASAAATSAQ